MIANVGEAVGRRVGLADGLEETWEKVGLAEGLVVVVEIVGPITLLVNVGELVGLMVGLLEGGVALEALWTVGNPVTAGNCTDNGQPL